jgi:hypothetical protein
LLPFFVISEHLAAYLELHLLMPAMKNDKLAREACEDANEED